MALFAKRLENWASEVMYGAILAIAKKKGGAPISYIVYRYIPAEDGTCFMMRPCFSQKEAKKLVTSGPQEEFMVTSSWLNHVATGFWGDGWMRVPTPRIGGRQRGRKPPLFGDLGYFYRKAKAEEFEAHEHLKAIERELDELIEEYGVKLASKRFTFRQLCAEQEVATEAWHNAYDKWVSVRCEIEYARSKRTGIPINPSSVSQLLLKEAQS